MLADYDPLSERELGLRQMDQVREKLINTDLNTIIMIIQVDLLKTGCAGWWFVQLVRPPYSQVRVRKFSHPFCFFMKIIILIMFAGLGSKHVPSTARRVGKIESNLDDRVDVITPKV